MKDTPTPIQVRYAKELRQLDDQSLSSYAFVEWENQRLKVENAELRQKLDAMTKLLGRHEWELQNMCTKLDAKEEAGWEGTRRRCVLQQDTKAALDAARKEAKL